MRLDKYLANNTALSRKEVRQAIKSERVKVDGVICLSPAQHISQQAVIELDRNSISSQGPGYFMLNKPEGCVCSHADEHYPSVFDLFEALHQPLHVAGRLDVDTTGLVLVTGDGQWSHRITSPAHSCRKRYRVWLEEVITDKMIERLEKGVFLLPEKQRTRPAQVEKVADDEIVLTITEGRYHQVKRMLEVVENRVERLHREQIGDLKLDSALAPGEWRELTEAEIGLF